MQSRLTSLKTPQEQVLPRKHELVLEAPRGARKTTFTAVSLSSSQITTSGAAGLTVCIIYLAALENSHDQQKELIIKEVLH